MGSISLDAMDLFRIKERIQEIAASPKNVRFEELVTFLDNHIGPMYPNYNHHGGSHHAFTLGDRTFTIPASKRPCVKQVYVREFLKAMEALGLFEPGEDDDGR